MTKINSEDELPSAQLNRLAVERVRDRMRAEGWATTDEAVAALLVRVAAISPSARGWAATLGAAEAIKTALEQG